MKRLDSEKIIMSNVTVNMKMSALYMKNLANEQRIATLEAALTEAHRVILHELDSGRTPYMLKAENGGKGLGYFEDVLTGAQ
ncbi:MAG: hypothetical protein WBH21_11065 [Vibrio anguillarum]